MLESCKRILLGLVCREPIKSVLARQQVRRDPQGPESGKEHVIRGGSYLSDAGQIRLADRDQTRQLAWLRTDPHFEKVFGGIPIIMKLAFAWSVIIRIDEHFELIFLHALTKY